MKVMIAFNKINTVVLERRILTTTIKETEQKILHAFNIIFTLSTFIYARCNISPGKHSGDPFRDSL